MIRRDDRFLVDGRLESGRMSKQSATESQVRRRDETKEWIMADRPQSLGKIIVQGLGGVLVLIAIVCVVMYFLKPQQPPPPTDTRQISFEPKEITLDKGQSQVVRLQIGNPPDANFQVVVEAPLANRGWGTKVLESGSDGIRPQGRGEGRHQSGNLPYQGRRYLLQGDRTLVRTFNGAECHRPGEAWVVGAEKEAKEFAVQAAAADGRGKAVFRSTSLPPRRLLSSAVRPGGESSDERSRVVGPHRASGLVPGL